MPISLSHLGEVIVAKMAERERLKTIDALGLTESADLDHVRTVGRFAFHECKLAPHHGYIFDGASRVDVILWIRPDLCIALELKLGATRLTRTRINDEFLDDCRTSHNGRRIAGNMMAILDRRFGHTAPADGLEVELYDTRVPVSRNWFVVTRQSVLDKWVGEERPNLSLNTSCVTISSLVAAFGGQRIFNTFVRELLDVDYFNEWVL
jgi:hypothetical protein